MARKSKNKARRAEEREPASAKPAEAEVVVDDGDEDVAAADSEINLDAVEAPADRDESQEADSASESAEAGALVPYDPLNRYLAEIRRFPLLSREEELEIAKRYQKFRDQEDAYRLVTGNLRLVVKIAHEFSRASRNLLDLI